MNADVARLNAQFALAVAVVALTTATATFVDGSVTAFGRQYSFSLLSETAYKIRSFRRSVMYGLLQQYCENGLGSAFMSSLRDQVPTGLWHNPIVLGNSSILAHCAITPRQLGMVAVSSWWTPHSLVCRPQRNSIPGRCVRTCCDSCCPQSRWQLPWYRRRSRRRYRSRRCRYHRASHGRWIVPAVHSAAVASQ